MNTIKAFAAIDALVNNTDGVVAPFGELSTYATTYSKDKGIFTNASTYPKTRIVSFSTKDVTGAHIALSNPSETILLAVADWVRYQFVSGNIPVDASKATFITTISNVPAFSALTDWEIGELLAGSGPTENMPDYVKFTFTEAGETFLARIWFSDNAFRAQYDEIDIIVIPPYTPIDDINASAALVVPILAGFTANSALTAITAATLDAPPTLSKIQAYTWHDPSVPATTLTASFCVVIYGAAGNTSDNIKLAIKAYIADHSVLTNWADIFPDLYAENEFVFMPRWNHEADSGGGLTYPIYNPTERVNTSIDDAELLVPVSYAGGQSLPLYLELNLEATTTYFRSLSMLVVGAPNNNGGIVRFTQRFPDYTAIDTTTAYKKTDLSGKLVVGG